MKKPKKKTRSYLISLKEAHRNPERLVGVQAKLFSTALQAGSTRGPVTFLGGVVISAEALRDTLAEGSLEKIKPLSRAWNNGDRKERGAWAKTMQRHVLRAPLPTAVRQAVHTAYERCKNDRGAVMLSVSAPAYNAQGYQRPGTVFALSSAEALAQAVSKMWSAHFSREACAWRAEQAQDHLAELPALIVQPCMSGRRVKSGMVRFVADGTLIEVTAAYGAGGWTKSGVRTYTLFADGVRRQKKAIISEHKGTARVGCALAEEDILALARAAYAHRERTFAPSLVLTWSHTLSGALQFLAADRAEQNPCSEPHQYTLKHRGIAVSTGNRVSYGIAAGSLRRLDTTKDRARVQQGDILYVSDAALVNAETLLRASAVVFSDARAMRQLGSTCRERGIPCAAFEGELKEQVVDGKAVTLDCSDEQAVLYQGLLPFESHPWGDVLSANTKTRVHVSLQDPALAPRALHMLVDGIDVRMEDLSDPLASSLGRLAARVYPKPLHVHLSIPKARKGRQAPSPLSWYQGAYNAGFKKECAAVYTARQVWGLDNIHITLPTCATPEEAADVLALLHTQRLVRGEDGLHIGFDYRLAAHQALAPAFMEQFDSVRISVESLVTHAVSDLGIVRRWRSAQQEQKEIRALVKQTADHARAAAAKISVTGDVVKTQPALFDMLLGEGVHTVTVPLHDVPRVKARLQEREVIHERSRKQTSRAYVSLVAILAMCSASLLTLGSGCIDTLAPADARPEPYVPPAVIREHLEEKMKENLGTSLIEAELNRRAEQRLPEFTLAYPDTWRVKPWDGGITFHDPESGAYISLYRPAPPRGTPEAVSERIAVVIDGQSAFRFDAIGSDSTAPPVHVVEMILPTGDTLVIEGNTVNFDALLETLTFSFASFTEQPEKELLNEICIQVISYARDPETGQCIAFPTPCDVPDGWEACTQE